MNKNKNERVKQGIKGNTKEKKIKIYQQKRKRS